MKAARKMDNFLKLVLDGLQSCVGKEPKVLYFNHFLVDAVNQECS